MRHIAPFVSALGQLIGDAHTKSRTDVLLHYSDAVAAGGLASAVSTGLAAAVVAVVVSPYGSPATAADDTGFYSTWAAQGVGSSVKVIAEAPAMPMGNLYQRAGLGIGSGATNWIPPTSPMGKVYGSSQNKTYLSATVPAQGTTDTITFDTLTPATGWSFAVGDVDAEAVKVSAKDHDGKSVPVHGWFDSVFNFCETSPRPSGCGGAQTDKPAWDGKNTLTGNSADTHGATGWFTPTQRIKSLTFTATRLVGLPSYQVWIATDTTVPSTASPVTIEAYPPAGKPPNMTVDLGGTTKKSNVNVYVYRAKKPGAKAKLVASTKSTKKKKWKAKRVPMGKGNQAFFCARVGNKFSNTIRVKGKAAVPRVAPKTQTRGDLVRC